MNLLITGGCGFIGSNFINYYYDKYSNVNIICIDRLYYCASLDNIRIDIQKSNRFTFIKGNICDFDLIKLILINYNITHIIHFAAQSHVDNSFNQSFQYTQDNVVGTHIILEAVREVNNIKSTDIFFLHFSTDEVYGESLNNELKNEFTSNPKDSEYKRA
jgi:dTDP-D-glucose 4,6-dehydratase